MLDLITLMTLVENAALPTTLVWIITDKGKEKAAELLERFWIGERLASHPNQIFVGQQSVAIACILGPAGFQLKLIFPNSGAIAAISTGLIFGLLVCGGDPNPDKQYVCTWCKRLVLDLNNNEFAYDTW